MRATLNRNTEVDIIALSIDLHALDLILTGLVLVIAIWVGSEFFQNDQIRRSFLQFQQEVLHVACVGVQHWRHDPLVGGDIVADGDWLVILDPTKDILGAG